MVTEFSKQISATSAGSASKHPVASPSPLPPPLPGTRRQVRPLRKHGELGAPVMRNHCLFAAPRTSAIRSRILIERLEKRMCQASLWTHPLWPSRACYPRFYLRNGELEIKAAEVSSKMRVCCSNKAMRNEILPFTWLFFQFILAVCLAANALRGYRLHCLTLYACPSCWSPSMAIFGHSRAALARASRRLWAAIRPDQIRLVSGGAERKRERERTAR